MTKTTTNLETQRASPFLRQVTPFPVGSSVFLFIMCAHAILRAVTTEQPNPGPEHAVVTTWARTLGSAASTVKAPVMNKHAKGSDEKPQWSRKSRWLMDADMNPFHRLVLGQQEAQRFRRPGEGVGRKCYHDAGAMHDHESCGVCVAGERLRDGYKHCVDIIHMAAQNHL